MTGPSDRDIVASGVDNEVEHADKHVLLDVGIKLTVDLLQGRRRGEAVGGGSSE